MINRDPKCVFVAANAAEAAVVANWLEHQGVPAQVMDTMTLDGLTAWAGVSARGIEVWALRQDLVDRTRQRRRRWLRAIASQVDNVGNSREPTAPGLWQFGGKAPGAVSSRLFSHDIFNLTVNKRLNHNLRGTAR
jgi:hypothetical protein